MDADSRYVEKRSRIIYDVMVRRGIVIPEYEAVMGNMPEGPHDDPARTERVVGEDPVGGPPELTDQAP